MGYTEAHDPRVLAHYEGLIFKTAQRYVRYVDEEVEDIQQILRIKVHRALLAFDATRADALSRDRFVFSCIVNQAKDLVKKRRRQETSLEQLCPTTELQSGEMDREMFELEHLSESHDEVYGLIDENEVLVPSTLSQLEREIVCLLYRDYKQWEVARLLAVEKRDMERSMRSIRTKMANWRPAPGEEGHSEPTALPPVAEAA